MTNQRRFQNIFSYLSPIKTLIVTPPYYPFALNNFESTSFKETFTKFCLFWPSFSWKRFLKDPTQFSLFFKLSPLERRCHFSFEQNRIPFNHGYFVGSVVENDPVDLKKWMDRWTKYDQKSSFELKTDHQWPKTASHVWYFAEWRFM